MKKFLGIIILLVFIFCLKIQALSNVNETEYLRQGDSFLNQAQSGMYPEFTSMYLKKAQYFYYVASKNTPPSIDALIGLGRVYMLQGKNENAKNALFRAYSLDPYNADANFFFAQYCYENNDFEGALKYYNQALSLGYNDTAKTKEMIKKCYLKLGDEENAENIYE